PIQEVGLANTGANDDLVPPSSNCLPLPGTSWITGPGFIFYNWPPMGRGIPSRSNSHYGKGQEWQTSSWSNLSRISWKNPGTRVQFPNHRSCCWEGFDQ